MFTLMYSFLRMHSWRRRTSRLAVVMVSKVIISRKLERWFDVMWGREQCVNSSIDLLAHLSSTGCHKANERW